MLKNLALIVSLLSTAALSAENNVRLLYDFENAADVLQLAKLADNVVFDTVQDNGVTRGRNCARAVFKQGADYSSFVLGSAAIKDWRGFDYIAVDIFSGRDEKIALMCELYDALAKNYATRCTFEQTVRPGKQTALFKVSRAKRNGKEGLSWDEAQPKDKIDMSALTRVKFFLTPPKSGGDLVWWIDNIRLLKEDALGNNLKLELPPDAKAFDFGAPGSLVKGFTSVSAENPPDAAQNFTLSGKLKNIGKHWPDPLTGDGVYSPDGAPFTFNVKLPDGKYNVWLSAGPVLRDEMTSAHLLLKIGDQTIIDEKPATEELHSEKWLYRFMRTQYSERENALWLDFIDRMYATHERTVTVAGGKLDIAIAGHWLSTLIILPENQADAYKKLAADIRAERIRVFNSSLVLDPQKKPAKQDGDSAFVAFIPDGATHFTPATAPNDKERARKSYDLAGAPSQRLSFRLGVTPFEDLGKCALEISALKGPSEIPPSAARIFYQDYRVHGGEVRESALIPSNSLNVEKGVSSCLWAWLKIPDDAPPGEYAGTLTFRPAAAPVTTLPIKLTVYPFALEPVLPFSFGMYYSPPKVPDESQRRRVISEQLKFMREIGFTASTVGGATVSGIKKDSVVAAFDSLMYDLVKEAGMGRHPAQMQMANSLGAARGIARRLEIRVDQNPGCEMEHPRMKPLYLDFARQYAAFIAQQQVPVAVEIVDEPREVPNPWNRNLVHTNLYGDWLKEAGVKNTFVTPMGDTQSGKDYTSLVDHADIVSTHAGKGSERLMKLTPEKNKILWLYNTGMDRLSWGFYNWRVGSAGRWEWHFCWIENGLDNGYINEEWYNPFTGRVAFAPYAPYGSVPGAMLFQSAFLTCAEGITDSAYLVTLEKAIAAAPPEKSAAVARARAFLDALKNDIPFLPGLKGITSEAEGALVGKGLEAPAAAMCETWRRKIAELLIELK